MCRIKYAGPATGETSSAGFVYLPVIHSLMLQRVLLTCLLLLSTFSLRPQKTVQQPQQPDGAKAAAIDRSELIAYAKTFIGTPYRKGSMDPKKGFDCSGFVNYVFRHFDLALPRSSREYKKYGKELKPEEFRVGDILVFYGYKDAKHIGHVGIVCEANGMKSKFIHSSSGKAHGVTISNLESEGYSKRFYKCVAVIK